MESRKLIASGIIGLLLVAFIVATIAIVSTNVLADPATGGTSSTVLKSITDPIKSMFSGWQEGKLSINLAKYLFLFLVTVIIYSIISQTSLFSNNMGLKFLISLIVSFLAIAYLTPSDLYTILASYGALGFVLAAAIPFIILVLFSVQVTEHGGGVLLSKFFWLAFVLFLVWKLADGVFGLSGAKVITPWEGWAYAIFIILSALWVIGVDRYFMRAIGKAKAENAKDRYEEVVNLATAKTVADARAARRAAKAAAD